MTKFPLHEIHNIGTACHIIICAYVYIHGWIDSYRAWSAKVTILGRDVGGRYESGKWIQKEVCDVHVYLIDCLIHV